MALSVNFWRLGAKAVRVVTADGAADEPVEGVPAGAMLFRTDTGEHRAFDGEAWASSGGGEMGPQGEPGQAGQPGRSVQVFEQAGEPVSAVAGDIWIIP